MSDPSNPQSQYIEEQVAHLVEGLTRVLFGDHDVVLESKYADPRFGNLAMMVNVVINAMRNAHEERGSLLEKVKSESQLVSERSEVLEAVLSSTEDGIFFLGETNQLLYSNRILKGQVQLEEDKTLRGEDLFEVFNQLGPEDPAAIQQWLWVAVQNGRFESKTSFAGLEGRVFSLIGVPTGRIGGGRPGRLCILRDITEVEAARRAQRELLGTVSHELKTPLTSIRGYVDLLAEGRAGELTPMQSELIEIIRRNTGRLDTLIQNELESERLESGSLELLPADPNELVSEALDLIRPLAKSKGIEVHAECEAEGAWRIDRRSMQLVMRNLLSNAIKYTEHGEVRVRTSVAAGRLRIEVRDTGIGIDGNDRYRIFDRFYRSRDPKATAVSGSGVGLAICRAVVEQHGGKIGMHSEYREGTTFWLEIP